MSANDKLAATFGPGRTTPTPTLETRIAECGFRGCAKDAWSKGYCASHLSQQRRTGKMSPIAFNGDDPLGNFWKHVDKSGACWVWTGSRNRSGYGLYSIRGKSNLAHRWIFESMTMRSLGGAEIDHACHNRACVRFEHLRAVTRKQNIENLQGSPSTARVGIRGVSLHGQTGKYVARVKHHGKSHSGGLYDTAEEAGRAAHALRLKLFTHNDLDRIKPKKNQGSDNRQGLFYYRSNDE